VLAEVPDTVDNRFDRADERITAQAQANDFAADCIFLISEGQGHKGGPIEVDVGGELGENAMGANVERDVLEAKGGAVGRGSGVFARATEEEEGNTEHVDDGEGFRGAMLESKIGSMVYNGNRDGLDAIGRWVRA
jgi:hypothetical protein